MIPQSLNRLPVILVFDIGKTTKKVVVFDHSFRALEEKTEVFKEIPDDDGFPSDDLPRVSHWVKEMFQLYLKHESYQITHCNVSAYGASLVHLDIDGDFIHPFYNYLKPFPERCLQKFNGWYNTSGNFSAQTASPYLGLLNSGLQLFWLKHEKQRYFERINTSLHLPQFFAYLLTGKLFTDITSVGCHTILWNFETNSYHDWVSKEKLIGLFPPMHPASHVVKQVQNGSSITFGIGVHDSSAALMPYLVTQNDPFLLLSTGTWNICFNPFNQDQLTTGELAADCLCYYTYEGKAVKASRIFLGHEHEMQVLELAKYFNVSGETYQSISFNADIYSSLVRTPEVGVFYPIGMEGTGPIPDKQQFSTDFTAFETYEIAYHQLMRYLVKWQLLSIDLVDPEKNVRDIIVVGGFTKSPLFLAILKKECGNRRVLISDHPRASALGAAWLVAGESLYKTKGDLLSVSVF